MKKIKFFGLIIILAIIISGCLPQPTTSLDLPSEEKGADKVEQQSPISQHGVLQFEVNKLQTFYLEAEGANEAFVRVIETEEDYPLSYDEDLKLWQGDIVFYQPGVFHLEGHIKNIFGEEYIRKINTVIVVDNPTISSVTGEPIEDVVATIYVKDPATGEFNMWNGLAFGQNNPLSIPEGFSVILPTGEYYVTVEAKGYDPINSLITNITEQSIVTADINLGRKESWWDKIVGALTPGDVINNFALNVMPIPQENLLKIGSVVPDIIATDQNGQEQNLFVYLTKRPTIIYVHSNWNTEAQEQMDIYEDLLLALKDKYNLIPLTTMEPDNINLTQIDRGDYQIEFFKPNDKFYDDYFIISLPQFFVLNENKELLGVITGSRSNNELMQMIDDILVY